MLTNATKKLLLFLSMFTGIVFSSCQKDAWVDLDNPPPIPGGVLDSSLLIKSLKIVGGGVGDQDSVIEFYSYDTTNRKITITWKNNNDDFVANGAKAELSYNVKGLLTRTQYTYPPGYVPWDFDYNTIDLAYDNDNVLQKVTSKYMDGEIEEFIFTKIAHPGGGYRLTWNSGEANPDDSTIRRVEFDKNGNAITSYTENHFYPSPGNPERNVSFYFDSLAYTATGDVEKIFRKIDYPGTDYDENYIFYEFSSRKAKGDQLYNHRQVLLNGIANIPFWDLDQVATDGFGFLSVLMEYENIQYSKTPSQMIRARMWDNTFENFTVISELDSKDRLTKFTGFFQDYELEPMIYTIEYYK
jgi:hypothetical protein